MRRLRLSGAQFWVWDSFFCVGCRLVVLWGVADLSASRWDTTEIMNEEIPKQKNAEDDEMRPEYDFSTMPGGVRGKYYKA